jgi:hypothetical protein
MKKLIDLFKEENFDEIEKLIEGHQDYVSSVITKLDQVKWIYKRNDGALRKVALMTAPFLIKVFEDCSWLYNKALSLESKIIILDKAEAIATTVHQLLWIYNKSSDQSKRNELLLKIESKMISFGICHDIFCTEKDELLKNLAIKKATSIADTPHKVAWLGGVSVGNVRQEILIKAKTILKNFDDCKELYEKTTGELQELALQSANKFITSFKHCRWLYKRLLGSDKHFPLTQSLALAENVYNYVWIYRKAVEVGDIILAELAFEKIKLFEISFIEAKWLYYKTEGELREYWLTRAKGMSADVASLISIYESSFMPFDQITNDKMQEVFNTYEEYERVFDAVSGVVKEKCKERINKILWD